MKRHHPLDLDELEREHRRLRRVEGEPGFWRDAKAYHPVLGAEPRDGLLRVRVSRAETALVDAAAQREGVSRSDVVRRLIRTQLQPMPMVARRQGRRRRAG